MQRSRRALARHMLGLGLVFFSAFPTAQAQTGPAQHTEAEREASARLLFQEGVQLADSSRWPEAADRFQRALALRDSAVIAYNLASALRQLGDLVDASTLLQRVANDERADPELRASAKAAFDDLAPRIGHLTVHVEGQKPRDRIAIDDKTVPESQWGIDIPIDPGTHIVTAQRGEQILQSEPIVVLEGSSRELRLRLASPPAPRDAAKSVAGPGVISPGSVTKRSAPSDTTSTRWWLWAGAGALVVGAVTLAVVAISNGQSNDGIVHGDFDPPVLRIEASR